MRILHVITSLSTGGAERLMVDLLPRLQDLGNDVEIAVFCSKETIFYKLLKQSGIKVGHDVVLLARGDEEYR